MNPRSSTTLECSMSIQHSTIPLCLTFLFTMEGGWNTPVRCGNWCKLGSQVRGAPMRLTQHWISSTQCGRGKFTLKCTLKIQQPVSGLTIVKGPRMGALKWEEKRHSSSLKTQEQPRKSKSSKKVSALRPLFTQRHILWILLLHCCIYVGVRPPRQLWQSSKSLRLWATGYGWVIRLSSFSWYVYACIYPPNDWTEFKISYKTVVPLDPPHLILHCHQVNTNTL